MCQIKGCILFENTVTQSPICSEDKQTCRRKKIQGHTSTLCYMFQVCKKFIKQSLTLLVQKPTQTQWLQSNVPRMTSAAPFQGTLTLDRPPPRGCEREEAKIMIFIPFTRKYCQRHRKSSRKAEGVWESKDVCS